MRKMDSKKNGIEIKSKTFFQEIVPEKNTILFKVLRKRRIKKNPTVMITIMHISKFFDVDS